jgi:hypothetical protein
MPIMTLFQTRKSPMLVSSICLVIFLFFSGQVFAAELSWPRDLALDSGTLTVYQPQIDDLENDVLEFRAAVSFTATGKTEPVFGAAWFESRVEIDRAEGMVRLLTLTISDTRFPEGSEKVKLEFEKAVREGLDSWNVTFSLDVLLTSLEAAEEEIAAAGDLNMDPPVIIYRNQPALLIMLDGEPVQRDIENSPYKAVINTPYPLIVDSKNIYYLNAGKGVWYQASAATGPYKYVANPPTEIANMVDQSEMEDSDEIISASNAPEIVVSTKPAELIVTVGPPRFEPLVDDLLVISNSASDVFMHVSEQSYYIVLSGRWFTSDSMNGPWLFIQSDTLPTVFQSIPENSNQADSRVYVAGTDEAREAVMDAQIPQTAAVKKGRADIEVTYDGTPIFVEIPGVELKYARNTGFTVIQASSQYYLVEDAVWYVSAKPTGPWDVAESRPAEVESIPSESPVYNVKYVYIYETTPEVVYVGYTPGYTGSYVYHTTIVYGTGWYYRPWVTPYYYYPRQATWGVHVTYNPWTGWGYGLSWGYGPFRVGFHSGGYWHRHHHWHHHHHGGWGAGGYRPRPVHYGNNNINIGSINVNNPRVSQRDNNLYRDKAQRASVRDTRDTPMNRDSRERVASRDASVNRSQLDRVNSGGNTGSSALSRDSASTRNGSATLSQSSKQNNVFADKQGNVFRNTDNGWQQRESGSWKNTTSTGINSSKSTRPANDSASNRSATRESSAYRSSQSGYNRPSSLDRQSYSRQRSSSRSQQHSMQRSSMQRSGGGRRR